MHATDMNSLVSIFKTGLCPASLQKEKARRLADMVPAVSSAGKRTTVQFAAISNSKRRFMVRDKKPLLLVFSATAIAANFETWVFDDNPIVATPFVVKNIAFWWDGYLKQKDLRTYSDGQAAAASFNAQGTFKVRKLVQASASACAREANKDKKPPSHLRGKQIAERKALHDQDSIEAQLAATGKASSTTTHTVNAPPPPSHTPPDGERELPPPPSPEPTPMEVDQEAQPASSAALPAETPKEEKESELSDKEEEKKDKAEDSDSDLSSLGDDLPAEAEDQDTDEEREVAQRLVKHRSVNAGQERVLCKDDKGKTVTLTTGEAATAQPVSELSDEGMESEELIEDDPVIEPATGRVWKCRNDPPEPASPQATSRETKYRPIKQRRQNKMPPRGKPKAYKECPEPGTICPYCSEITDLCCRKCGDTACSDCRTTGPDTACSCHKHLFSRQGQASYLSPARTGECPPFLRWTVD